MTSDESALPSLLQRMVEDIKGPECGYWLYSNYFDVQPPTERRITRWWQAPLYIDYDRSGEPALWNPAFEDDAMLIDVILKNELPAQHERIRIEYAQIWSLKRFHFQEKLRSSDESVLYHNSSKLKMPPTGNED